MVGSSDTFLDGFLEGAARALFVSAYADYVENRKPSLSRPRPGGGEDWMDFAPDTPPAAYALAGMMQGAYERENASSIGLLAEKAEKADGARYIDPEQFGHYLAMMWMGSGVSWFDDHAEFPLEIPYHEISALSFDYETYKVPAPKKRRPRKVGYQR